MTSLSAALIQLRTPASQEAALAQAEPLIREAAAKGAALIVTPRGPTSCSATARNFCRACGPPRRTPALRACAGWRTSSACGC